MAVALFHYKPSHTTLPSPPPASSKAPLPSIWDLESSSEPGTATFGCVPTVCVCVCVCVCFSKVLAIPYFATAVHTQGVATQSTASEHSQESGVPAGFRTRFSAFTGISTTQEGLRAALFTCPSPQLMSQFPGYTEQQVLKTRGI